MPGAVLIVDDNPLNLKLARLVVQAAGFEALTAASASETLRLLETFEVALVLMDIQLPDLDGLELTRRIRADPRWQGLKIIAVTANAMSGDQQKAHDAGCDGYMAKPIDTDELARAVTDALRA